MEFLTEAEIIERKEVPINSLIQGDCLNIMPFIKRGSIDLHLSDPPYFSTPCSFEWDIMTKIWVLWENWKRIIKDNGAIVMTAAQPFTTKLISSNYEMFKYCWYWDKIRGSNFATVKIRPFNSCEEVVVLYNKQPTYNPQMTKGKPYTQKQGYIGKAKQTGLHRKNVITKNLTGERYPLSLLRFSKQSGLHDTQKPVELFEYLIRTYTDKNDLVFDGFAGSATAAIACINTNRRYILIEKDKDMYEIAKDRIIKHQQKTRRNTQNGSEQQDDDSNT